MKLWNHFVEKALKQGRVYSSLDAMKMFAIVNMTSDHVGDYLFPHQMWWRMIGRITFPVWFFLVGYSRGRGLSKELYVYAVLMTLLHLFVGFSIFPLNALVSIIICRWVLNLCTDRRWLPRKLPELISAFIMLTPFTMPFFEYGTIACMYAVMGRMVREKEATHLRALVISSYLTFIAWMAFLFPFNSFELLYVTLGTAWVVDWLSRCPNGPIWQDWTDARYKRIIAVLSRNTLPYYFYHRVILQILGALLIGKGLTYALQWFN